MASRQQAHRPRAPWHLWVIGVLVLLLYAAGARDYVLILLDDRQYLQTQFGPEGTAYFTDYPLGLRLIWTINIAGGLVAGLLLLLRTRWTVPVAVIAAAAQLVLLVLTFSFLDRWEALGAGYSLFDIAVGVVTAAFAAYCWVMRSRGVLR